MDGLRDLVNSQACDDGSGRGYRNPLGKLVDHVYRDKSQREQVTQTVIFLRVLARVARISTRSAK